MKKKYLRIVMIFLILIVAGIVFISRMPRLDSDVAAFQHGENSATISSLGTAIEMWGRKHGRVPTDEEKFSVLGLSVRTIADGWQRPFIYKSQRTQGPQAFLLYSLGPNGIDEGGHGDDIVYRRERSEQN
ncbi:hypothetical protein [Massilia rubra]|uniref:Type II secretion system protein GspG C-terminal domain-containing protein n=1 Tax=Massilia rubra TaxID=2607910 RepID=A0ABX0LJH6_9BURK|nr:hypothetical protein [Massilia rubra]NHZ34799.1 hypothetical protein [Massilia rubra]